MTAIIRERAVHSGQLERWLGKEAVEGLSASMRDWYGPPIPVAGVKGKLRVHKGGDFRGRISEGKFASARDVAEGLTFRTVRALKKTARRQAHTLNAGFASLDDLIAEATAGKLFVFPFQKAGATGVVGGTNSLWAVGNQPAAGANGSAAPGGRAPTSATTGALPYTNPTVGGDTLHLVRADVSATVGTNQLLLYDRIFDVAKTMNSTATEAVTGVPTRYQNTTGGTVDSAEGNFLFVECTTVLPATVHNWTVCTYTDQANTTGVTLPSLTGNASNIVGRLDHPLGQWFAPLATGDTGIKALTQMQCSALVASGTINFVIGHPLMWIPCQIANMVQPVDGVLGFFGLQRIFDNACLSMLEVTKGVTTAATYTGTISAVAG